MSDEKPTDQTRTSENDIHPDSAEFQAIQRKVAKLIPCIVPYEEDVSSEQVYAALCQRGLNITKPTFDEIVRSAEPTPRCGWLSIGGVWIVPQLDEQNRVRYVFRR